MNKEVKKILHDPYNYANDITKSKLEKTLRELSYYYYNTKTPLISDDIYDILFNVLKERFPQSALLKEVGAPISKDKVKLPYPLGSLEKIKPETEALPTWKKNYNGPYVISDKLDGVSALLYKNKEGHLKLYSRGDGYNGQDISHLITYVFSTDFLENSKMPVDTAVRGELIISKENFKKIENDYKNARNTVAGVVNSKTYAKKLNVVKITEFIAYALIHPRKIMSNQMKLLKEYKFKVVDYIIEKQLSNESLSKKFLLRRTKGEYKIDGIVVIDSSKSHSHVGGNPKFGFAFKQVLTDHQAEAKVLNIEWDVSMDGYLKPVVIIEPVKFEDVVVKRVTAHNAKYVKDNVLGPGSTIELIRSGDVIPYINKVLSHSASNKPKLPTGSFQWNKNKVDIITTDPKLILDIKAKRMDHFFKIAKVKDISIGIIKKLVEYGITDVNAFLEADYDDIVENVDKIGKTMINKIVTNLKTKLRDINLPRLMAASHEFGRGFAYKKIKAVTDEIPNILELKLKKKELIEKIDDIDGFDKITATQFVEGIEKFKKFYEKLKKQIYFLKLNPNNKKNIKNKKLRFEGMKIVFTGFRNEHWEEIIDEEGGKVSGSVSKNTNIVVYAEEKSKYKKTKSLIDEGHDIKLMTPVEFSEKFKMAD